MTGTKLFLGRFFIFLFLVFVLFMTSTQLSFESTDSIAVFTMYLNGVFFLLMIVSTLKNAFSIEMIFWIFMFFFMFYAPLIQYTENAFPWHGKLSDTDVLNCNMLILLFSLCFCLGKLLSSSKRKKELQKNEAPGWPIITKCTNMHILLRKSLTEDEIIKLK